VAPLEEWSHATLRTSVQV